jgi:hypothetical protein
MITRILSHLASRFITPKDAAAIMAQQAEAKRERERLTMAELQAATHAALAEETARFGPITVPRRA